MNDPTPEMLKKVLDADFSNLVKKVATGRPLTAVERARIEARAADWLARRGGDAWSPAEAAALEA